ncbi:SynChlorMet cassette protein ScmC [Acidobacteriota bacterium]
MHRKGYSLTLKDNCKWWITGQEDALVLADEFASITKLEEGRINTGARLIFSTIRKFKPIKDGNIHHEHLSVHSLEEHAEWTSYNRKFTRIWRHKSIPDVLCECNEEQNNGNIFGSMWFSIQAIYQRSIAKGGLPFHAALADLDGKGILLAGSGDTGKSTCCRRLPNSWKPLCDDETLVVIDDQKRYWAHPFPTWSEYLQKTSRKTWNVQHSVPVNGVFFIRQSPFDEVVPVKQGKASILMYESADQACRLLTDCACREDKIKVKRALFINACEMARKIPTFILRVSLRGRFWEKIEKALDGA